MRYSFQRKRALLSALCAVAQGRLFAVDGSRVCIAEQGGVTAVAICGYIDIVGLHSGFDILLSRVWNKSGCEGFLGCFVLGGHECSDCGMLFHCCHSGGQGDICDSANTGYDDNTTDYSVCY